MVGGTSSDSSIVKSSNQPNAFLVFYLPDGTIRWNKNFVDNRDSISSVTFSPDSTQLVFITDPIADTTWLVRVNPSPTYTQLSSHKMRRGGSNEYFRTVPGSFLFDGTYLFVGT